MHEPPPDFVDVMRAAQLEPAAAREFWIRRKLPAIAAYREPIYAETSHLFCEGFVEPLLSLGVVPDIVVLIRNARDVALSLHRIGTIPGRSAIGLKYLVGPDDPGVLPLAGWREMNDYQLCYWYCLEIERRARIYERLISEKGGKVITVNLAELNTLTGFNRLKFELDLPSPRFMDWARYLRNKGRRVNTKSELQHNQCPRQIDRLERQVLESAVMCPDPLHFRVHV